MASTESKLLYSATMSLDGYIAGVDGDMSWLSGHADVDGPDIQDLMSSIGALLVGRRTFDGDDPNRGTDAEGAFGGQWSGPSIVLTHRPPSATDQPDTTFATDLDTAVAEAKRAADGKYVNILGADVARQCLAAGVLDEVLVLIAPILLGDGTALFRHEGGTRVCLEPIDPLRTGRTANWYRVGRA